MSRKQLRIALCVLPIAATALALGVSQGFGGSSVQTASIQKISDNCGQTTGHKSIGKVTFSAEKGTVYATVELRNASPNTTYTVYLYFNETSSCSYNTSTKIQTDSGGNGKKTLSDSMNGHHDWFVDAVDTTDNENPSVHLP
jgi:hypothetical protein